GWHLSWTSVARSPQQNRVVERRNRTLIETARTMLIYAQASLFLWAEDVAIACFTQNRSIVRLRHGKTPYELMHARTMSIYAQAPLFLWAEAVATACFTQNRSIIRLRHGKTPYELMHGKQPDLSYFHVFGALCYPTNDGENVGKLQPKADIGIFIGYAPTKKAFRIYNRRTRRVVETIHVDFDELTAMASEQSSSGPALQEMIPATIKVAHMGNDPLLSVPITDVASGQSSSTASPQTNVPPNHPMTYPSHERRRLPGNEPT
nr:retrovirus-related Pol polyprotein from transposon TNT 1-94 [Tanacetum cinerariifolium]